MKLSEAKNLAEETRRDMRNLEISLEQALKARNILTRALSNARRQLKRKKENTAYPTRLAQGIIKSLKKGNVLTQILMQEIDKAVEGNLEFGRDEYRQTLYKVAGEKDIYKLIPEGTGWNIQLKPQIVFEEEAGQLDDWARGISAYRAEIKTKVGKPGSYRGLVATEWWEENVFGTALQTKTFRSRLEASGRGAPFWQILNNGSQPLPSDRPDNSYNPYPTSPTDFIGDAERAIKAEFRELMLPEKERWFQEVALLEEEIRIAQEIRDGFNDDIRGISPDKRKNTTPTKKMQDRSEYAEEEILPKAVEQLRADEKSETPTQESMDVGITGQAKKFVGRVISFGIKIVKGLFNR